MQKITPFLWFNDQAEEATNFYISIFKNSRIVKVARYSEAGAGASGRAKGTVMTVAFQLEGQDFIALNGGPHFTFTPAISFFVNCRTEKEVDELYQSFSEGGSVLMPLQKYPFSEKFAWIQDRYGVSWQINLAERTQKITPFLMFVGEQHGKAEAAINFYISLFENSSIGKIERYGAGGEEPQGTVRHATFTLDGQEFMAIDSHYAHPFTFSLATSFVANCETQEEIDELWARISAGGETSHCGWIKDQYGVWWQIVPAILGQLMSDPDPVKAERVMKAVLQMEKLEIAGLKQAYEQ